MKRSILLALSFLLIGGLCAQGFPQAQKQPRFKESKKKNKHYKKQSKRKRHKMGALEQTPVWQAANSTIFYPGITPYMPVIGYRREEMTAVEHYTRMV